MKFGNHPRPEPSTSDRVRVTIVGAGVTGLTAAHELVERGFDVLVLERATRSVADVARPSATTKSGTDDAERVWGPDVGGVARTQWCVLPQDLDIRPGASSTGRELDGTDRSSSLPDPIDLSIWDTESVVPLRFDRDQRLLDPQDVEAEIRRRHAQGWTRESGVARLVIYQFVRGNDDVQPHPSLGRAASQTRRRAIEGFVADHPLPFEMLQPSRVVRVRVTDSDRIPDIAAVLSWLPGHTLVPGEHGYRFFAGFYRNLRDTLRRTPILDPVTGSATGLTAHDQLREVPWQGLADPQRPYPSAISRRPFKSLGELQVQSERLRRELGYRPTDWARFMLRMARYLTSCRERREQCYEDLTWWDFATLQDLRSQPVSRRDAPFPDALRMPLGRRFAASIEHTPKALVAMAAESADARTQGTVFGQLMLDWLGLTEMTDSTLNGPTSEAWLRHWRTYLEARGVQFRVGDAQWLELDPNRRIKIRLGDGEEDPSITERGGYVVVATDVQAAADLVAGFAGDRVGVMQDLDGFAFPDGRDPESDPRRKTLCVDRWSRFQTMSGLQLYYASDISLADAHVYFGQSPWGLSAVSQFQYWTAYLAHPEQALPFASNLSIDIGAWRSCSEPWRHPDDPAYATPTPNPTDLTTSQIAREVESQLAACQGSLAGLQVAADAFHIDDCIVVDAARRPVRNDYPYLINVVSDWKNRPRGRPWSTDDPAQRRRRPGDGRERGDVWQHDEGGYLVHYDSLVFAGTQMRTFTRMATMEAANESARHAVNAILDHLSRDRPPPAATPVDDMLGEDRDAGYTSAPYRLPTPFGDYCSVWDPERHEVPELEFLKQIDRQLLELARKKTALRLDTVGPADSVDVPHVFDLLQLDRIPDLLETEAELGKAFGAIGEIASTLQHLCTRSSADELLGAIDRFRDQLSTLFPASRGSGR